MPESNYFLQALLDGTTDNVVLIDPEYRILCFNKNLQKTLELYFKRKVKEGDNYLDYVVPDLQQAFIDAYAKAANGETHHVERETKNGEVSLWFQYKFNPVYTEDNHLLGVAMTATDITEKKIAELRLQSITDSFQAVVENTTESVILLDLDGRVVLFNQIAFQRMKINQRRELSVGSDFKDFLYPGTEPIFKHFLRNAKEGRHSEEEFAALNLSGAETWLQSRMYPVYDKEHQQIIGASLFTINIDGRKKTELQLKKTNKELSLLNHANDIILNIQDEQLLLEQLCRLIVEEGSYKLTWICLEESYTEEQPWYKPFVVHGETSYLKDLRINPKDPHMAKGPTSTVMREGGIVITNNFSDSEYFKPWLESAKGSGISSSIVLLLRFDASTKGCLNIYSGNTDAFDEAEVLILKRLANNISLAVQNIRTNREKEKMQYNLKERVKELRTIYLTSAALQNQNQLDEEVLSYIVEVLPHGWQYPDICAARISFDGQDYFSKGYSESQIFQKTQFTTVDAKTGSIQVVYKASEDEVGQDPFLMEEVELINTLSEMLKVYFNKKAFFNELKKSEANLSSVFKNTEVGHLLLDKDLNVITFNHAFLQFYELSVGWRFERGENFINLLRENRRDHFLQLCNKIKKTLKPEVYEVSYQKDGLGNYYTVSAAPVMEENVLIGFCLTIMDVTERRQREMERRKIISDLLQRNQMLEQFAYIVSHNIRSPLSNILGLTRLLVDGGIEMQDMSYTLKALHKSGETLDQVLHDLNDNLQIRRGIAEPLVLLRCSALVDKFKKGNVALLEASEAVIHGDFNEIDEMTGIESYLQNIFNNLLSNAIKFARRGVAPEIYVWTKKKEDKIEIHIKDNGTGIDLERQGQYIFGLYKRFNLSIEGKGIGLFTVKSQVEALDGKITVDSKLGAGTHFSIELPV